MRQRSVFSAPGATSDGTDIDARRIRETVEILAGSRGAEGDRAVRLREFNLLLDRVTNTIAAIDRLAGRGIIENPRAPSPDIGGIIGDIPGINTDPPATPTNLLVNTFILTDGVARLEASWDAAPEPDIGYYVAEIGFDGGNMIPWVVAGPQFGINCQPGQTYSIRVFAVDVAGNVSGPTTAATGTVVADDEPPAIPTGLAITSGFQLLWLKWNRNTEPDLHHYEIYEAATSTPAPTTGTVATFSATADQMARSGLPDSATRHYWIRAVDTSGNKSAWSTRVQGTTATSAGVDPVALADALSAAVGIVPSAAIAPRAIVSSLIAVTDPENLVPDGTFSQQDSSLIAAGSGTSASFLAVTTASSGTVLRWQRAGAGIAADVRQHSLYKTPVSDTQKLALEIRMRASSSGTGPNLQPRIIFHDSAGAVLSSVVIDVIASLPTSFTPYAGQVTPPAGACFASWSLPTFDTTSPVDVQIDYVRIRRAGLGQLLVDGEIQANHLTTGELLTLTAQIKNAIITDAKIANLSAAKLVAGTALTSSLTVNGDALSTIQGRAADPAARINAASTQIDPGKIVISGGTTLADWRKGGDLTKIDGGNISANTIAANAAVIGMRGVSISGVQFEHNSPTANKVSWTGGTIQYINDAGTATTATITASNATWTSGTLYLYWEKGTTTIGSTTTLASAMLDTRIVLATYRGGVDLVTNYGRTVIDGSTIKTGTVDAAQMATGDLSVQGMAAFGGTLQSSPFTPGSTGWQIKSAGDAEFNTAIIRNPTIIRPLVLDSGTITVGDFTPTSSGSGLPTSDGWGTIGKSIWVDTTSVPISAWAGTNKTYVCNVAMTAGTVFRIGGTEDIYWGWVATVLPLTRWNVPQTLRLRIDFYSHLVSNVTGCEITWKIYEIT